MCVYICDKYICIYISFPLYIHTYKYFLLKYIFQFCLFQLRQEIKKLENMERSKGKQPISDWCYFSAIKFLIPTENNARRVKVSCNIYK